MYRNIRLADEGMDDGIVIWVFELVPNLNRYFVQKIKRCTDFMYVEMN